MFDTRSILCPFQEILLNNLAYRICITMADEFYCRVFMPVALLHGVPIPIRTYSLTWNQLFLTPFYTDTRAKEPTFG